MDFFVCAVTTGVAATLVMDAWSIVRKHVFDVRRPAIAPALLVGLGTVAAPFLVLQPAMGAGVAASRTPDAAAARLQSLVTHAVFGFGLYAGGWAARFCYVP